MPPAAASSVFLAHGLDPSLGWWALLPYAAAIVLAIGLSLAIDRLWRTATFGDGHVRRFATLAGLVVLASAFGLGLFWVVERTVLHV